MQTTSVLVTGKYSGYKLKNLCKKPQVLTFRFMPSKQLMERHHFNWHQSQLKYLGVLLTKNLSQLYNVNYKLINKNIYDDLGRWSLLPLDLGSRIRTIKMDNSPKIIKPMFSTSSRGSPKTIQRVG